MFESLSGLPSTRVREGRVSSLLRAVSGDSHSSCGFLFDNRSSWILPHSLVISWMTEIGVSELNSKWFWLDIPVFIWVISEKEAMPLSAFKLTCFLLGAPIFISFLTGIETFHI